ncbi:hypothetical protein [Nonomuraea bangladeshensis]|uniref:hypothetical protein n=1 Tax=Nonomuraea bangladeshensis TaxID=404385 RepID=UPI0031D5644B
MSELERTTIDEQHDGGMTGLRHWVLAGPKGAVQVSFMKLPDIPGHFRDEEFFPGGWTGADFAYHALFPLFDGQTSRRACGFVEGGQCFYGGSSVPAQQLVQEWAKADFDDEVIWLAAELGYRAKFLDDLPDEPTFQEKARALGLLLGGDTDGQEEGPS